MSDKIKPSEVSQVLLEQLKGLNNGNKFDEVGTVLEVSDGVARIYGLRNAEANELLEFENGTMAIVMNLEEDNVGCVLLGSTDGIKEGMVVKRTKRIASINVNDNMLGRVINPLGQAIDGKGAIDLTDSFVSKRIASSWSEYHERGRKASNCVLLVTASPRGEGAILFCRDPRRSQLTFRLCPPPGGRESEC